MHQNPLQGRKKNYSSSKNERGTVKFCILKYIDFTSSLNYCATKLTWNHFQELAVSEESSLVAPFPQCGWGVRTSHLQTWQNCCQRQIFSQFDYYTKIILNISFIYLITGQRPIHRSINPPGSRFFMITREVLILTFTKCPIWVYFQRLVFCAKNAIH